MPTNPHARPSTQKQEKQKNARQKAMDGKKTPGWLEKNQILRARGIDASRSRNGYVVRVHVV